MASRSVREQLAHDIGPWLTDGLISKETHDFLRERYTTREFGLANVVKSFGVAGGVLALFGLFGFAAALAQSQAFAAFIMLAGGGGLAAAGIRLASDKLNRYAISSKVLLMFGVVTAALGVGVGLDAAGVKGPQGIVFTGILIVLPMLVLAYLYKNTFLLSIALIMLFHWVGSWASMWGRSTYELDVQDPKWMSVAALVVLVVGVYHEYALSAGTGRFYLAYETLALIYLNLSLLILTIEWHSTLRPTKIWIAVWALAAILQIVAGARLHNSLFVSFGVTALFINIYTRYFENFWNQMHSGVFLLLGGGSLFAAGLLCELALRRWQRQAA